MKITADLVAKALQMTDTEELGADAQEFHQQLNLAVMARPLPFMEFVGSQFESGRACSGELISD